MSKQITFEYEGTPYTLEYSKKTVKQAENGGLDVSNAGSKPMNTVFQLFSGAFKLNHPYIKKEKIEEMFEHLGDLTDWLNDLIELYNDPYEGVTEDKGEIKRTKSW